MGVKTRVKRVRTVRYITNDPQPGETVIDKGNGLSLVEREIEVS